MQYRLHRKVFLDAIQKLQVLGLPCDMQTFVLVIFHTCSEIALSLGIEREI